MSANADKTLPERTTAEPDGYAVVIDDPSSPRGYWFAYAYIARDTAEKAAKATKGRAVPVYFNAIPEEVVKQQAALRHPATQVFFRAGLLACREYMARFVEQSGNPEIAASIRANWWPSLGADFGPPRLLQWDELAEGEPPNVKIKDWSPTQEALPVALQFLESIKP
jgi:hypothetical protein